MICPKCGAKTDGIYLNGCFKCLINPPSKACDSQKEAGASEALKKPGQGNLISTNKVER
jgi:hypothetical protein